MTFSFTKMHGAGNDFVVIDDRSLRFPVEDQSFLMYLGVRRTGVGCEGIILMQPSQQADLRMRFFNPDGVEQEMCGNGARCFAWLAVEWGAALAEMTIETLAGQISAKVVGDQVSLVLTEPSDWALDLVTDEGEIDFVNTGVPHAVMRVEELEDLDVAGRGRALRFHSLFAPQGTNANFLKVESDGSLSLRTYERGVEAETLACGTGATAAAVVAEKRGWVTWPVVVHCVGGDLTIDTGPTLTGGAVRVFEGEVEYGDRV